LSKTFKEIDFKDLLQDIKLTSSDIFNTVYKYDIPIWNIRLEEIENDYKLPMFIHSFYSYILKYQVIPTSDEFFTYYKELNKDFFKANHYSSYLMIGLQARCYRLYPSLIREFHFTKIVQECLTNKYKVIYNIDLDVREGIDMMIIKDNNFFGINLFVDTYYSKVARGNKKTRHTTFDNVTYVDSPILLKAIDTIKCGNFVLYGYNHYHELINKLNNN